MPGYMVYRSDRNQHGGGVILLVHKDIRHDSYAIPNTSRLEAVAVIVHTTQRQNLHVVSGYNPPTNIVRSEDIKAISLPMIFMGDFNGKHMAWNCASNNRNGKLLIDFCTEHSISAPTQYTYFPSQGQTSTLNIVMSRGCVISPPQSLPALSSDHNPVVYKIRLTPQQTVQQQLYDYRQILTTKLQPRPRIRGVQDFDRALHLFTASILMAAEITISKRNIHMRRTSLPVPLVTLIQLRNCIRRQYQRTRHKWLRCILLYSTFSIQIGRAHV